MDDTNAGNTGSAYGRSDEELSWDSEFADTEEPKGSGYPSMLGDLAKLIVQVPRVLGQIPMVMLPEDTVRHARAAAREGFLAVRSLLGAIGDSIESALTEPAERGNTVSGPAGTWGSARHSTSSSATPAGKARRIDISDEVSERGGGDGQAGINIEDLGEQEGRGLRADIDY